MRRNGQQSIRVLVAEPFPLTSDVICRAIGVPDISVVGRATQSASVLSEVGRLRPDLVVLDGALGYKNGLISRLKGLRSPPKVIVLGDHADDVYQEAATASGADRFVLKVRLFQDLLPAIRAAFPDEASSTIGQRPDEA
ncbi:MAG TPA: response regulator [bacterium]|jgi:DNA-binding NarL/FixJ family response regulator|nr:response regulator [bacterium]